MAREADHLKKLHEVAEYNWVVDWHWKLNMTEMSWAILLAKSTSGTAEVQEGIR
jgi:hypothetical protein